jgi:hypothetical protein
MQKENGDMGGGYEKEMKGKKDDANKSTQRPIQRFDPERIRESE